MCARAHTLFDSVRLSATDGENNIYKSRTDAKCGKSKKKHCKPQKAHTFSNSHLFIRVNRSGLGLNAGYHGMAWHGTQSQRDQTVIIVGANLFKLLQLLLSVHRVHFAGDSVESWPFSLNLNFNSHFEKGNAQTIYFEERRKNQTNETLLHSCDSLMSS